MPKLENDSNLALCLSGGGLRATYFHLGVIWALRQYGMLPKVVEIYSVSGGSIAAAHLLKRWNDYTSDDDAAFENAHRELRQLASRDLRGRIVRRWMLAVLFVVPHLLGVRRTMLLENEYRRFFGTGTIKEIASGQENPPLLRILATSFNSGNLCSFDAQHFVIEEGKSRTCIPGDIVPMHFAIAASSAFPPLFPPVRVSRDILLAQNNMLPNELALTDGGVFDNLGYQKFLAVSDASESQADVVILSDASGAFEPDMSATYTSIVARTARSTDILMRRVAEETIRQSRADAARPVMHVSIAATGIHDDLAIAVQQQIQGIRTDLNVFTDAEMDLLVAHGYRSARSLLDQAGLPRLREAEPTLTGGDRHWADVVGRAAMQSWGNFNPRDWTSYVLATGFFFLGLVAIDVTYKAEKRAIAEADLRFNSEATERRAEEYQAVAEQRMAQSPVSPTNPVPPAASPVPESTSVEQSRYRVYIQFAGFRREEIVDLANILAKSWTVPAATRGGERVATAAQLNEVRYGPPEDQAAAELLAANVTALGLTRGPLRVRRLDIIRPLTLEIWIGKTTPRSSAP